MAGARRPLRLLGLARQAVVHQLNRATGETQKELAEEGGLNRFRKCARPAKCLFSGWDKLRLNTILLQKVFHVFEKHRIPNYQLNLTPQLL
jgi:hypothetical protein